MPGLKFGNLCIGFEEHFDICLLELGTFNLYLTNSTFFIFVIIKECSYRLQATVFFHTFCRWTGPCGIFITLNLYPTYAVLIWYLCENLRRVQLETTGHSLFLHIFQTGLCASHIYVGVNPAVPSLLAAKLLLAHAGQAAQKQEVGLAVGRGRKLEAEWGEVINQGTEFEEKIEG